MGVIKGGMLNVIGLYDNMRFEIAVTSSRTAINSVDRTSQNGKIRGIERRCLHLTAIELMDHLDNIQCVIYNFKSGSRAHRRSLTLLTMYTTIVSETFNIQ